MEAGVRKTAAVAAALAAACAVIFGIFSARSPDPKTVRAKRLVAERVLLDLENQRRELIDEERKFKVETDRLDSQARELAVARVALERQVDAALGVRYSYESGLTKSKELEDELAVEIAAMEAAAAAIASERDMLAQAVAALEREKDTAPPARAAEMALEIEKMKPGLAAAQARLEAARIDIAAASAVLAGK